MFKKEELSHAREIIDSLVQISPERHAKWDEVSFAQKLDRLSELIDALRFDAGCPEPEDSLTTFRPNRIFANAVSKTIGFVGSGIAERSDRKRAPELMLPLLDYLYTHPGKGGSVLNGTNLSPNGATSHSPGQAPAPPWVLGKMSSCPVGAASQKALKLAPFGSVLSIIHAFVREYLPSCHMADFQRTATGVLRIETNVRFAAHELRKIGLLQCNQTVAFKTWRLSLLGILAASKFPATYTDEKYDNSENIWRGTLIARLDPKMAFDPSSSNLEALCKLAPVDWPDKNSFLDLVRNGVFGYRAILSSEKRVNQIVRCRLIENCLVDLNNTAAAEYLVAAFDGVPSEQLEFLWRAGERHE
jgi:hypothetical protein